MQAIKNSGSFLRFHPFSQLIYFISVLSFPMFFMHPVILLISLFTGIAYNILVIGKDFFRNLKIIFPMFLLIIIINPLFSHGGMNIIFYLPDGNPFTLESVIFGIGAAVMMSSVMIWYFSLNRILTSERIIFLFGKFSPNLALLISMILGFIPKFDRHLHSVTAAQYSIGRDMKSGSVIRRIKNGITIFASVIQWAPENAIDTADSMKSRGYGSGKRTSFSRFSIKKSDFIFILICLLLDIYIIIGADKGILNGKYYPSFVIPKLDFYSVTLYAAFLTVCIMPLMIDLKEDIKWRYIISKV